MNEQEKKMPSPEEIAAKMKAMGQNPDVMQQATKMLNMAYAFQFAQAAVPKVMSAGTTREMLADNLALVHKAGGVVVSVVQESHGPFLIVYYGKE